LVVAILVEILWLFAPINRMAVSYRRTERMTALREWAAAHTPETQAAWDRERQLLDAHFRWIILGISVAIVAEGALAVFVIQRRVPHANAT
jgi:hypothetical protein